ncbi:MAG: YlbF family regulator [Lactobacillales bacterium]|jgi:cell fate (sporulation/competence/biofilm development) regulator YmcA (YheA/YmcA/DUF963 family)|nr:YlbF family regulator [Lactobacillales bacterium]
MDKEIREKLDELCAALSNDEHVVRFQLLKRQVAENESIAGLIARIRELQQAATEQAVKEDGKYVATLAERDELRRELGENILYQEYLDELEHVNGLIGRINDELRND